MTNKTYAIIRGGKVNFDRYSFMSVEDINEVLSEGSTIIILADSETYRRGEVLTPESR